MFETIVRRRGRLCGLLALAIGACFIGQSQANPVAAKDASSTATRRSWSFLTDADPGEPIDAGATIAFLTLGAKDAAGYAVEGIEGLEELGTIVRVQFGAEHLLDDGTAGMAVDDGYRMAVARVSTASATLITADGAMIFTWGFRSSTTLAPTEEDDGDPVSVNLFRPMGMMASPIAAESAVIEIATRLPGILDSAEMLEPGATTGLTPTGGWAAYWQCLQACMSAGYLVLYQRLLLCLQIAGVLTAGFSAICHIGCGFIAIPCILACLGVVLPAGGSAASACVTAYAAALPLVAIGCAAFCW